MREGGGTADERTCLLLGDLSFPRELSVGFESRKRAQAGIGAEQVRNEDRLRRIDDGALWGGEPLER